MKRVRANKTLLRKTLAHIKANPEHWNQGTWACGTSHCFGGWAAILTGWEFLPFNEIAVSKKDTKEYIFEAARKALRLNNDEASTLFNGGNSLKTLERMVANLCEGRDIEAMG